MHGPRPRPCEPWPRPRAAWPQPRTIDLERPRGLNYSFKPEFKIIVKFNLMSTVIYNIYINNSSLFKRL
jgi:hypothetical protein